ncbi:MAG: tyrosine-type recombinase/integrase [Acidimicrobiales bacterium]
MATLTERKPGVWFARVFVPATADGAARQVGRVFRGTKKAVRAEVAAWEAEIRGRAPAGVGATVADLLAMWQAARAHEWQPTTARDHRSRAGLILADLGSVRLLDLDPLRIDAWLAQLRRRGVGVGAIRGRLATLKAAASWGVSRRLLRSNPVADAAPRLALGRRSVRPEPEQVVALLEAATAESVRGGLALRIAAVTGAREAEVVALAWDDLVGADLRIGRQRHSIDGEALVRERTKSGGHRTVLLDAVTVAAIAAWRAEAEELAGAPTRWMVAEPGAADPPSPRWLRALFMRAAERAGIPAGRGKGIVLHDLRVRHEAPCIRAG